VLVSADDRYLFVADNNNSALDGARKLWRFDLRKDGTVDVKVRSSFMTGAKAGTGRAEAGRAGQVVRGRGLNKPNPPFEPAKDKKGGIYVFSPEGSC